MASQGLLQQSEGDQDRGGGRESAHDRQRVGSLTVLERLVIEEIRDQVHHPGAESQQCRPGAGHFESERDQRQAEDAHGAQPEDVIDNAPGLRPSQQHFVPDQRNSDQSVREDGDQDTVPQHAVLSSSETILPAADPI